MHSALLLHASVARHVRVAVKVFPQKPARLVVVPTTVTVTFVPHTSPAEGASKAQAAPHSTIRSPPHTSSGAVVSTTVMVWLQTALLLHASVARQVRVALRVLPQKPTRLVLVLRIVMLTFVPEQRSLAVGASKFQPLPHSTVRLPPQESVGGVVSTRVTVWLQVARLVQASTASHVRVAVNAPAQAPALVTVPTMRTTGLGSQWSATLGASKAQAAPHSTVLAAPQVSTGATVSRTVMVRLRVTALLQASVAVQLWLISHPHPSGAMPLRAVRVTLVPPHRSRAVTTGRAGTSERH